MPDTTHQSAEGIFGATGEDAARWMAALLETLDTGVVLLGPDGEVKFANRAALELTGDPARIATSVSCPGAREVERSGPDREVRIVHLERRRLDPAASVEVLLASDVTLRRGHAGAGEKVEKLQEALRVLSVISHKINNPLTALLGRAQILKARSHTDPNVEKAAHVIEESASRIAELARELSRVLKESRQETVDQILALEAAKGS